MSRALLWCGGAGMALLWGVGILDGMLLSMFRVSIKGEFPDGRPLRNDYTGFRPFDQFFGFVVAFYDLLPNDKTGAPRLLFFDIFGAIAALNMWVLFESRRRGVRRTFLRHTIVFFWLWNFTGAAAIAPFHLYFIAQSGMTYRDPSVPLNEARAFPFTVLATALFPLFIFVPAWNNWSAIDSQNSIVIWQWIPMVIVGVTVLCSRWPWPGPSLFDFTSVKRKEAPNEDAPWVEASFYAMSLISAVMHLYVVLVTLFASPTKYSDLSFSRMYIPNLSKSFNAPLGSQELLLEGSHLFSQFDFIVISATAIVYSNHMLQKSKTHAGSAPGDKRKNELPWIILGTLLFGPGAAGSFVLALREPRLRLTAPSKTK